MVGFLWAMGVRAEPSLIRTLPVVSVTSEMRCRHTHLLGTLPPVVPVVSAPSEMRCVQSPDGWWGGEETGAVAAGEFPKVPQRVFFFLGKILLLSPVAPSILGRACPLTQPTSPARPVTVRVRVPQGPSLNSPQPAPMVSVGLPLRPYSPP